MLLNTPTHQGRGRMRMLIQAQSNGTAALNSAIVAAVVALLVALLTQLSLSSRESRSRRYERRRSSLLNVQDCALELRLRLREYGAASRAYPGERVAALTKAEAHFDDASSALEVALSRVEDRRVSNAVSVWRANAQISFVSVHDISASQEHASWQAMNTEIGRALTSKTGATPI